MKDFIPEDLPFSPACERNREPIAEVLEKEFPASGDVLEIGSGTGQHAVYFSNRLPGLRWQPSDRAEHLPGLAARVEREGGANVLPPIELDVYAAWPDRRYAAAYSANTAHIMAWDAVQAMFKGLGDCLHTAGVFCLYGPFNENGTYTSHSNGEFDRGLKARDPAMGIRDREAIEALAAQHALSLRGAFRLPANNQLLVFLKSGA
ncbi:MAG: DUF938 domain-containing protein [Xanthomonadales bacterium]|nr:DUF938 domain-containing protein [Xanthomonadales bacterium]